MLETALFKKKNWINRRRVGGSAPNPRWPPAAEGFAPRCRSYYFFNFFNYSLFQLL